jgi:hypothetical protein
MDGPELLTLEEAAARLPRSMTVGTLRGLIRKGVLPHRMYGRRLWLTPADLWRLTECPERDSPRASGGTTRKDSGSSATAPSSGGRAAAMASVERLRQRSRDTSKPANSPAAVVQLTRTN